MKNFLNNLTWFISFAFSFGFFSSISSIFGNDGTGFWLGLIFGFIIKFVFFSESYIYNSLEKFYNNILENIKNDENIFKENKNITKKEEIKQIVKTEKIEEKEEKILSENDKKVPSFEEMLETEKKLQKHFKEEKVEKIEKVKKVEEKTEKEVQVFSALKGEFIKTEVGNNLANFFKENLLAKIGALMLLIGVGFLMLVLWNTINDFTKIVIGFLIGFSSYFAGVWLDKKKLVGESRILMGIGIGINYLVILAGRYIFSHGLTDNESLSIFLTFSALVLNTIFGVFTSLKYKNKNLLIFSFVFAYINPLLLGATSEDPYTLLVYTLFVTISAIFIGEKVESKTLVILSFLAGNFFFLIAPTSDEIGFLTKLTFTVISSFIFINTKTTKNLEISEGNLLINSVIFSPIILQSIFKNVEISDFSFISGLAYSSIIFGYFIWKAKKEEKVWYLSIATSFVIFLSLGLNFGYEINIYTFIASVILALVNIFSALFLEKLKDKENFGNYCYSLVGSSIFLIIGNYAFKDIFVSNISILGYILTLYSAFYLVFGAYITKIFSIEDYKKSDSKNIFIMFFSLFLSLFTIGIGLIINDLERSSLLLLSTIWLIEALLILVIYKLTEDNKFKILSNIVSTVGILVLFSSVLDRDGGILSFIITLIFVGKIILIRKNIWNYDYFIHISGMILSFLVMTIGAFDEEYILLGVFFSGFLGILYSFIQDKFLKGFFLLTFLASMFSQIIFYTDEGKLEIAILGIIMFLIVTLFYQFKKDEFLVKVNTIYYLFLFIFSSIIVVDLSASHYSLGIFWGIIGSLLILIGLFVKKVLFRTIGLYIICLMIGKIILTDIWHLSPFLFLIIGPILIVVSIIYTKFVGNDISKEFALKNIFGEENQKEKSDIISEILKTDVSDIESISFIIDEKEFLKTKFKKIIQIMKFIENKKGKNTFEENELLEFYNDISKKYPQKLSNEERKQAEKVLHHFAEKGGKIIFNKK